VHVALYLTYLLNNGSPEHPVSNAVYGIKWAHEINGLDDPTKNFSLLQYKKLQNESHIRRPTKKTLSPQKH
jgi:hypothetical protein